MRTEEIERRAEELHAIWIVWAAKIREAVIAVAPSNWETNEEYCPICGNTATYNTFWRTYFCDARCGWKHIYKQFSRTETSSWTVGDNDRMPSMSGGGSYDTVVSYSVRDDTLQPIERIVPQSPHLRELDKTLSLTRAVGQLAVDDPMEIVFNADEWQEYVLRVGYPPELPAGATADDLLAIARDCAENLWSRPKVMKAEDV